MGNKTIYFKNLDTIRFIAALMVFLGHAVSPSYQYLPIKNSIWEKLLFAISNGGTGVSIFFVLSGFLITYLLINEYEFANKISLRNFYIRRILRIWPLYFLIIVFSFVIYPTMKSLIGLNNPIGSNMLYHLVFLSNFDVINIEKNCFGSDAMSQNITWSVSIEEQFYLFWPLIFVLFPRKLWLYLIVFVILASLLFRVLNSNDEIILYFHTFSVLLDLGIGGLLAFLIKSNEKIKRFFEGSGTFVHISFFMISFILIFWSDFLFSFNYGSAVGRFFISTSFALIISAQAMTKMESKLSLSNVTIASNLGKYTYGIYLIHPIAMTLVDVFARISKVPQNNFINLIALSIVSFSLTLLLSKLSFKYYESLFLFYKRKFTVM